MSFLNKIKNYYIDEGIRKKIDPIIKSLPNNESVLNEILLLSSNTTTKCVLDKDIKSSYYVYVNDTIYLSNTTKTNEDVSRICLIAHECIHSKQSKILQKINFIFSNLELIIFFVFIILTLFNIGNMNLIYMYVPICILSIIPRLILEFNAVFKAPQLANTYLKSKVNDDVLKIIYEFYLKSSKRLLPLFVIMLLFGKVVRILILIVTTLVRILFI